VLNNRHQMNGAFVFQAYWMCRSTFPYFDRVISLLSVVGSYTIPFNCHLGRSQNDHFSHQRYSVRLDCVPEGSRLWNYKWKKGLERQWDSQTPSDWVHLLVLPSLAK